MPHAGYGNLIVYKKSEVIYQGTYIFCKRFLCAYKDRTFDQMIQAARSCKQNIAEGSAAAGTSTETEIKLTNVASASLAELLEDYKDYLKAHNCREWEMDDSRKIAARDYSAKHNQWEDWQYIFNDRPAEILCNLMIVIINQTKYMIDRMVKRQENAFLQSGGIRERMYNARLVCRGRNVNEDSIRNSIFQRLIAAQSVQELFSMAQDFHQDIEHICSSIRRQRNWQ